MAIRSDVVVAGELLGVARYLHPENPVQAITAPPRALFWNCPPLAYGLHLRPGFRCRRHGGTSNRKNIAVREESS